MDRIPLDARPRGPVPLLAALACLALPLTPVAASAQTLATSEGPDGMVLELTALLRGADALTLKGRLVNGGGRAFAAVSAFVDPAIERSDPRFDPGALTGIHVVDQSAGQRAGPLFSETGACLCSTGLGFVKAGGTLPIYAQFPLPTGDAEALDVVLPGFLPLTGVPISDEP